MDKRGEEVLLMTTAFVIITLFIIGTVTFWINDKASGEALSDQLTAKQTALLIDAARAGSRIFIDKEIEIVGNKAKAGFNEYSFFTKHKVSAKKVEGGTEIYVEE